MLMQPPWSDIERLQNDIRDVETRVRAYAKEYELHSVKGVVDRLEHTVREISAQVDGLRTELQTLQADVSALNQAVVRTAPALHSTDRGVG